jgi:hypothetical protein
MQTWFGQVKRRAVKTQFVFAATHLLNEVVGKTGFTRVFLEEDL